MRKVFIDTSVLFPFSVMDLFLALAEDRAHRVLWTDELLDEWERVIVREQHRTRASAAAVTAAIREFFDDTRIDPSTYRDRVGDMPGPDPDDHVHSAAALAANATELITWDISGFPADELAKLGLRVIDPDTYLVELLNDLGGHVTTTIENVAHSKKRPPMSSDDVLNALERAGLKAFVAQMKR